MSGNPDQGPVGGITPHLTIHDGRCAEAIDFYARAFAAQAVMPPTRAGDMPPCEGAPDMSGDSRIMHAHLKLNGASLMLNDAFPEFVEEGQQSSANAPSPVTIHLQVDDADAWFERAVAAGAETIMPLDDQFWGDRYGRLRDPFGHEWSIGGPIEARADA